MALSFTRYKKVGVLAILLLCSLLHSVLLSAKQSSGSSQSVDYIDTIETLLYKREESSPDVYDNRYIEACFRKALRLSRLIGYKKGEACAFLNLGNFYYKHGNNDLALFYLKLALEIGRKEGLHAQLELACNGIATIYHMDDDYEAAIFYYFMALEEITRNFKVTDWQAGGETRRLYAIMQLQINIGDVFRRMEQYEKALHYLNKSLALAGIKNDTETVARILLNKSLVLLEQGFTDDAEAICREALELGEGHAVAWIKPAAITALGDICLKRNDSDKAASYYKIAIALAPPVYTRELPGCYKRLGAVYLSKGENKKARQYLMKGLDAAKKLKSRKETMEIYDLLSRLYTNEGNYREALTCKLEHEKIYKILMQTAKQNNVNLLEIRYRTAEREKQLAASQLLIAQQGTRISRKNASMAIIAGMAILLVAVFSLCYLHHSKMQIENVSYMKHEQELKLIMSAMQGEERERARMARELHDGIAGHISTIKLYFENILRKEKLLQGNREYTEALELLNGAIKEVRQTAHNLMPELLLNHGLQEAARMYCMTMQRAHKIQVDFLYYGIIERFNSHLELFTFRIIQELLQNIAKHAVASKVTVQLSLHQHVLSVTIEDNGIGIGSSAANAEGIGLKTIRKRIKELDGQLQITSREGIGTSVYLEFNLRKHRHLVHTHSYQETPANIQSSQHENKRIYC